jgi:hypothetical protein
MPACSIASWLSGSSSSTCWNAASAESGSPSWRVPSRAVVGRHRTAGSARSPGCSSPAPLPVATLQVIVAERDQRELPHVRVERLHQVLRAMLGVCIVNGGTSNASPPRFTKRAVTRLRRLGSMVPHSTSAASTCVASCIHCVHVISSSFRLKRRSASRTCGLLHRCVRRHLPIGDVPGRRALAHFDRASSISNVGTSTRMRAYCVPQAVRAGSAARQRAGLLPVWFGDRRTGSCRGPPP